MATLPNTANLLFFMTICLGMLVFTLLVFRAEYRGHSSKLLALFCLCFSLFAAHNMLLNSGAMECVPHLFRVTKPLHYLPAPLLYLYIQSMQRRVLRFSRRDSIHFVPFMITVVDMLPFFMMDPAKKLDLVHQSIANNNAIFLAVEGFLPKALHLVATPTSIAVYIFLSYKLLAGCRRGGCRVDLEQNRLVEKWLWHFWALFLFFYICWLGVLLLLPAFPWLNAFLGQTLFSAGMSVTVSTSLFFYPSILYGFQGSATALEEDRKSISFASDDPSTLLELPEERCHAYMASIERALREQQLFLKPDLRLIDLANATGLPYYLISASINQRHATNVNAYINAFRVAHVKQLMSARDADKYTLEALATAAGFGSRSTFIRAFKRAEGCTPSEFIKGISPADN